MTIKNKLTLTIVSVFLIVIAILGTIYLSSMRSSLYAKAYENTAEKANESANVIAQLFDVRLSTVKSLAEYLGEDAQSDGLESKLADLFYLLQLSGFEYYAIQWYGNWYYVTESSYALKLPVTEYPGLSDRAVFGKLYKDDTDGLLLLQTIFDSNGKEIGKLIAKVPGSVFWDNIKLTETLASEDVILSKHSGDILYPSVYSGGELMVTDSGKLSETQMTIDDQIVNNISLTVPISNAELDVTVLVNNDEINKEYNNIVFLFFVVIVISLVIIGTFVYFASSRMTRSITDLSKYVAQMDADCDSIPEKFTKRSDEAGKLANSFSLLLTRLNSALDETDYLARHDSLTLLSNRYCLENDISELIREHQAFAFALLDVDDFKVINDSKGHDEGDRLLKDLASVFRTFKSFELATYRWGGDEFALIIFGNQMDQYERMLNQIMERVGSHFRDAGESRVTVSIGVCAYPESAVTYKSLLINADKALAWAKMSGKVNFCFYRQ